MCPVGKWLPGTAFPGWDQILEWSLATISNRSCCNVSKARCGVIFSFKSSWSWSVTVPLEDNVHLANRKTTKYSALVTACEENGFKTHMFALEVGCLGYCPHSFLHCFEALGLPKSAARQIRSEASKTALRSSYVLFLRRGMLTWECQAVLYWTILTSRSFRLFFFVFICFAISVSHRSHPWTTRSVSKHTHNTPSLFEFFNCQTQVRFFFFFFFNVLKLHSQKAKKDYPLAESLNEKADSKARKRQVTKELYDCSSGQPGLPDGKGGMQLFRVNAGKVVPSPYSIAYSSFSRASLRIKFPSSQSVALCLFFVVVRGPNLKRWRFGPTRGNKGLAFPTFSLPYEKQFWLGRTEQKRVKLDENEQRVFCLWLPWQRASFFFFKKPAV